MENKNRIDIFLSAFCFEANGKAHAELTGYMNPFTVASGILNNQTEVTGNVKLWLSFLSISLL